MQDSYSSAAEYDCNHKLNLLILSIAEYLTKRHPTQGRDRRKALRSIPSIWFQKSHRPNYVGPQDNIYTPLSIMAPNVCVCLWVGLWSDLLLLL